ncbi:DUF2505 domain-containing protein [Nakamurella alba]|uniref:DUF2505 domain-containing protein n=1 Tax=Nakamurella alba TaxID=2665158 RepID=UPI0018AC0609|nr:DUF2505 domain-containing protein [Nakamurella alba]
MPSPLKVSHSLPGAPAAVYALLTDRDFQEGRLTETGGNDPQVVDLSTTDGKTTIVTRQSIPASVLPSMVASMIPGDPVTERTEVWAADGDGYTATFSVVVKGAPASLKGTMTLSADGEGSTLAVDGSAVVPIPLFGSKVEAIIVEQVGALLDSEAAYTAARL